jgi:tRNA uridine 5-carboxymethylaminomethyl modification enzyme
MAFTAKYDIIVVGGGHAGIEAALVPARLGYSVLLLTLNIDTIGQMSCNPSIGGLAKGHLVKEVDAMGGEIGLLADRTAVQFRMLNRSKGPAVWSPRMQNDRRMYKDSARQVLENQENIAIKQEEACELLLTDKRAMGIRTAIGNEYLARSVILTTGTFLNGLMHVGMTSFPGGRLAESTASMLADSLRKSGLNTGRLKTGTSPRISTKNVDTAKMQVQNGDEPPLPFSCRTKELCIEQLPCYITRTNKKTHEIIQQNLDRSPLFTGKIEGIGPRYCPSIETKIHRFQNRDSHLIFIEPEGYDAREYYINGLATSLPYDVQVDMIHTIENLENAEITRPGYAVEYDFVFPIQLNLALESKLIKNLYCAGQINGTSGYEEAAAQGFIAGVNAVLGLQGKEPFILKRYEAYIGVLIDDLVTKNTLEPYRMFTSLAEHRLILRIDNVADRLMHYGVKIGLVKQEEHELFTNRRREIDKTVDMLKNTIVKPETADPVLKERGESALPAEQGGQSLFQILKRPKIGWQDIEKIHGLSVDPEVAARVEIETKYEGYINREQELIKKLSELENEQIPLNFDFGSVGGLSNEAKNKLSEVCPVDLDQASRIQGISPSDILLLLLHLKKKA